MGKDQDVYRAIIWIEIEGAEGWTYCEENAKADASWEAPLEKAMVAKHWREQMHHRKLLFVQPMVATEKGTG